MRIAPCFRNSAAGKKSSGSENDAVVDLLFRFPFYGWFFLVGKSDFAFLISREVFYPKINARQKDQNSSYRIAHPIDAKPFN